MTDAPHLPNALFAHAMWRSGSTYLASRFAASDRYLMFYEPCHEGIGRRRGAMRDRDRKRDRGLKHPSLEGGYFGNYDLPDTVTGKRLEQFYAADISLRSVYGRPTAATRRYLEVLARTANASGRVPFFGFCRSGTQMPALAAAIGAPGLHLWRSPREQFTSYQWPKNEYFMTGTILQFAFSREHGATARRLAPGAFRSLRLLLARRLPDSQNLNRYRLVRAVAAGLTATESYALFYLSWLICHAAGTAQAEISFSLSELADDFSRRQEVENRFGIRLEGLRPTPSEARGDVDYDAIETSVSSMISLPGALAPVSAWPPAVRTAA